MPHAHDTLLRTSVLVRHHLVVTLKDPCELVVDSEREVEASLVRNVLNNVQSVGLESAAELNKVAHNLKLRARER